MTARWQGSIFPSRVSPRYVKERHVTPFPARPLVSRADEAATFERSHQQLLKAEERYRRAQELYLDGQIDRERYEKELESYETSQKALSPRNFMLQ